MLSSPNAEVYLVLLNFTKEEMSLGRKKAAVYLGKYKTKRKLGKGAFGQVFLVEDDQKNQYALKLINKKKMAGENQHLIDYLQSQIDVMKKMDSTYMVKLYEFGEQDDNYLMLMQYCEGGDIIQEQTKLPGRVFSLDGAAQCLSHVIMGLEELHKNQYLHRDIKMQNVLVKKDGENKIYKICDFGFAKKNSMRDTVLGTEQFMAPQIYKAGLESDIVEQQESTYGYEVDMWAFGVLFYYMLNMAFPFDVNPYWSMTAKYKALTQQGQEFSYKKKVLTTSKRIMENCTEEVEDLFRKIFRVDVDKRITFSEIRQHPIFVKYFPKPSAESVLLYKTKFKSSVLKNQKKNNLLKKAEELQAANKKKKQQQQKQQNGQIVPSSICYEDESPDFPEEKLILSLEVQEIKFLYDVMGQIEIVLEELGAVPCLMLSFNLVKYHIILFNNYLAQLNSKTYYKKFPKRRWGEYFNTTEFNEQKKIYASDLTKAITRYEDLYQKCKYRKDEIAKINPNFLNCFDEIIQEESFDGEFYRSYRVSTDYFYITLKDYLKTHKLLKFYYYLTETCICHVYNDFVQNPELKNKIFEDYITHEKDKTPIFSYQHFQFYLQNSPKETLLKLAKRIIEDCMMT